MSLGEDKWVIWIVYNQGKIKKVLKNICEESEQGKIMLGGDLNARTGHKGSLYTGPEEEDIQRQSKHDKCNAEGELLISIIEEEGWCVLNGNTNGDEDGSFTFLAESVVCD